MVRWMRFGTQVLLFIASGKGSCGGGGGSGGGSATVMKLKERSRIKLHAARITEQ